MAKCVYCKIQIPDNSVVDVCRKCGIGVWGEKMFNAIVQNMEGAKEAGDLYQGNVTYPAQQNNKSNSTNQTNFAGGKKFSIVSDAINQLEKSEKEDIRYDSYNKAA